MDSPALGLAAGGMSPGGRGSLVPAAKPGVDARAEDRPELSALDFHSLASAALAGHTGCRNTLWTATVAALIHPLGPVHDHSPTPNRAIFLAVLRAQHPALFQHLVTTLCRPRPNTAQRESRLKPGQLQVFNRATLNAAFASKKLCTALSHPHTLILPKLLSIIHFTLPAA